METREAVDYWTRGFPGQWYVAFYCHDKRMAWWDWLSPRGFRHVFAFGYSVYAERWLIVDVTRDRTLVLALKSEDFPSWLATVPPNRTILRVDTPEEPRGSGLRLGFWCTRGVAHLLGIPSRALRPVALYRELLRRGAVPAFVASDSQDD